MTDKYTLVGKIVVPCLNLETWARWFEANQRKRHVADNTLNAVLDGKPIEIRISTVFLGLDHNHSGIGDPLLFETMVFGGPHDQDQWRYGTWDEAERGHRECLRRELMWLGGDKP